MTVKITNYGGIITELHVPDRDGRLADVTHGFDSVAPHSAAPQPNFVPVSSSVSRSTHNSGVSGVTCTLRTSSC
eukprot:gene44056-54746_t